MKPSRQKIAWLSLGLLAVLACCAFTGARARAQDGRPLLVVEVSEADHLAAQRLLALTEQPTQLVRLPEGRELTQALALGRAARASQVVVFDQALARVVVLRTEDGAEWTRSTDPASATPFVAAFVAVELLALSAGPAAGPAARAPQPSASWRTRWLGLRLGFDALAADPYRGSFRPELGLLAAFGRADSPCALLLELNAAPHAQAVHTLGPGRLTLARSDLTARAGLLWQRERFGLAAFGQAGVLLIDAKYRTTSVSDEHRQAFVVGLGAEPVVQLWPWLKLYTSAVVQAVAPRGEYRADATSALREPRLGFVLGAGLWLTLPIR